jgi:hypothetical protein
MALEPDRSGRITYRLLRAADDLGAITDLLHAAYAPLVASFGQFAVLPAQQR